MENQSFPQPSDIKALEAQVSAASTELDRAVVARLRCAAQDPYHMGPTREAEARARLDLRLARTRLGEALRAEAEAERRARVRREAEARSAARAAAHAALQQEIEAAARARAAAHTAARKERETRHAAAMGDRAARSRLNAESRERSARREAGEDVPPTADDRQEIQRRVKSTVDGGDEEFRIRMMSELLNLPEDEVRRQLHWTPPPAKRGPRPKIDDDQVRLIRRTTDPMPLVAARMGISVAYAYQVRSRLARGEVPDATPSV